MLGDDDSGWTKPDLSAAIDSFLAEKSPYDITTKKGYQESMRWFKTPEVQKIFQPYRDKYLRDTSPTTYIGTGAQGDLLTLSGRGTKPVVTSTPTPAGQPPGPKQLGRLPADQNETLATFKSIHQSTQDAAKLFKPSFVGPIVGRGRTLAKNFISMPDFVKFRSTVGQLRTIVYGLSGRQINQTEQEWLKKEILPAIDNPGPNFMATLEVLQNWIESKHNKLYDSLVEEGYIVGGGRIKPGMDSYFRR